MRKGPKAFVGFVGGTAEPAGRSRSRTGYAGDVAEWATDGRTNPDRPPVEDNDGDGLEGKLSALANIFKVEGGSIDRHGRAHARSSSGRFTAGRLHDDQAVRIYLEGAAFGLSLADLASRFRRSRGAMSRARARGKALVEGAKDRLRQEAAW